MIRHNPIAPSNKLYVKSLISNPIKRAKESKIVELIIRKEMKIGLYLLSTDILTFVVWTNSNLLNFELNQLVTIIITNIIIGEILYWKILQKEENIEFDLLEEVLFENNYVDQIRNRIIELNK